MNKELEALELVDKMANYILLDEEYGFIDDKEKQAIIKDRDTIKSALTELKAIKEANPSEAIKNLKDLKAMCGTKIVLDKFPEYNVVEQALLKSQELEKVLKIIFEKNVDIWLLKSCLTLEQYNYSITKMDNCNIFNLTKEEFDLLKRWQENE